jgi:signal transduction histidine kinase
MSLTKNRYDSLLQKLFKIKADFEKTKAELAITKKAQEKLAADNAVYQNSIIELREKLHLYQKQESEKTKNLENELAELRKYYQKSLQHIQELKSNESKTD